MSTTYTITLQNCAFFARHGVHDEEEFLGQRFFVDAELDVVTGTALETDSIDDTVNYGIAFTVIEEIVTGKRRYLIEALAQEIATVLCARFPQIELDIGLNDRPVDLIREGVDCVLRGGLALDESLVARPLALMDQLTLASPAYLERMGMPADLDDLARHHMVEYVSSASGKRFGLEFLIDGQVRPFDLPKRVAVNSSDGYFAACEAGYGLIQAPHYHAMRQMAEGCLVEVLPHWPVPKMALTALYPPHRQLSLRVRVFVDWLVELCATPDTGLQRQPLGLG